MRDAFWLRFTLRQAEDRQHYVLRKSFNSQQISINLLLATATYTAHRVNLTLVADWDRQTHCV